MVANGEVRCGICYKIFNAREEGLSYSEGPGMPADETFHHAAHETKPDISSEQTPTEPSHPDTESKQLSQPDETVEPTDAEESGTTEETFRSGQTENADKINKDDKAAAGTATDQSPSPEDIEKLNIEDESVDDLFAETTSTKSIQRPFFWGSLSLIALFALGLQWAWFQKDTYSLMPKWRPLYLSVCEVAGCPIPMYRNTERIEIERLAVKSHNDYTNVLVIDLIMNNYGAYPQPLPSLLLSFYDIDGNALAGRIFTPNDYLKASNVILNEMPTETPIRVSFDILDPGETAVNYNIEVLATPYP
jgi:hypothetical protein